MSSVRFTQPPVREVSLTVLWDPLEGLLAADVGDLLSQLRSSYPKVSERPAMPPWTDIKFPSIQVLADNEVLPYSWWLADESNNRLVRFQFDRIICSWRHTPSGAAYPEYSRMRADLEYLLGVTNDWLSSKRPQAGDLAEQARQVQIDYIDQIDMAPIDLLRGIVTSWQELPVLPSHRVSSLLGATLLVAADQPERDETTVKVESDGSDGSLLTLISATDRDDNESYLTSLDRAHAHCHETFLSITSEHLQLKWGRVDDSRG